MTGPSNIEWTEYTWNPTTGCDPISPGCDNCYAEDLSLRLQAMSRPKYKNGFKFTVHEKDLNWPLTIKKPAMIFTNSMSDFGHQDMPLNFFDAIVGTMELAKQHTFQVLTKRPIVIKQMLQKLERDLPSNVWLGVSVENRDYLWRVDVLKQIKASVRFISYEPALGPLGMVNLSDIHWIIAGGESGPHFRSPQPEWFREIRDQCVAQGAAFFFKQWGGRTPKAGGRILDGRTHDEYPIITMALGNFI